MRTRLLATALGAGMLLATVRAQASGPLEYPDNGSAAFSRGGAWLAVGTDPIAAHYNPAALATQGGGVSLEQNLAFNKVCFDRRNPGNELTGPAQGTDDEAIVVYRPVCNRFADAPRYVPSLALSARLGSRVGVGFAIVPPATYGSRRGEFPDMVSGYNVNTGATVDVPAPYRFNVLENNSTVLFPTFSIGVEVAPKLRVGAGFVWGFGIIDVESAGMSTVNPADKGDHAGDDSRSRFETKDLFVPGVVVGAHWSLTRNLDLGAWYRWLDGVRSHDTKVTVLGNYYKDNLSGVNPVCKEKTYDEMKCQNQSVSNVFSPKTRPEHADDFAFTLKFPMEARLGVRWHEPRAGAEVEAAVPVRDPLADDLWDVELDVTYSKNTDASTIEVDFPARSDGTGVITVNPVGKLPPNSDRRMGYEDTWGARLGGQFNAIRSKLGILAGTWVETAALEDSELNLQPVAALRGGFGGGVVVRQDRFDFHVGYQRHWNQGFDNGGDGEALATAGTVSRPPASPGEPSEFFLGGPRGADEFRTYHAVNGGKVVQSANVFTLGGIYRF